MAGNFFATSQDIRLEDGHILRARLQKVDGEWVDAEINLNDHIGNENGRFAWDSAGFADSAEEIRCDVEGAGPVCVLRARLRDENGDFQDSDLNLSERMGNNDGCFHWMQNMARIPRHRQPRANHCHRPYGGLQRPRQSQQAPRRRDPALMFLLVQEDGFLWESEKEDPKPDLESVEARRVVETLRLYTPTRLTSSNVFYHLAQIFLMTAERVEECRWQYARQF
ncbi:Cyanovirin-N [Xylariaceae sp. FL0016]|nr:Cyanovirin-N [Xylariaceae sp. FL0016]